MTVEEIVARLKELVKIEKRAARDILLLLFELDRLGYLEKESFTVGQYCIEELGMDERSAARRETTVAMMKRFPPCLDALVDDQVNMSTLELLDDVMTDDNCEPLLAMAAGMTEAAVRTLLMCEMGVDLKTRMTLMIGRTFQLKLDKLRSLQSHRIPSGSPLALLEEAMDRRIEQLELSRRGHEEMAEPAVRREESVEPAVRREEPPEPAVRREESVEPAVRREESAEPAVRHEEPPKPAVRREEPSQPAVRREHIPAAIARAVWHRDAHQCTYLSPSGRPCRSLHKLQLHHLHPVALGGPPTLANLTIRCATHNNLAAEQDFGPAFMAAKRAPP